VNQELRLLQREARSAGQPTPPANATKEGGPRNGVIPLVEEERQRLLVVAGELKRRRESTP
jgi:hypothetical protein